MSTVLININDNELSALKKFVRGAKAKMRVIDDEKDLVKVALTDEEHQYLLNESEKSPTMLAEDAEKYSEGLIKKWSKKK